MNSEDHLLLHNLIQSKKPFLVGRLGTQEIDATEPKPPTGRASRNAGISPPTPEVLKKFSEEYRLSAKNSDVMAVFKAPWFHKEALFMKQNCNLSIQTVCAGIFADGYDKWNVLELFQYNNTWIHALKGKKVLIVSPFEKSILEQYEKRNSLFPDAIYPLFESLQIIKAPLTQRNPQDDFGGKTWTDHLEEMKQKIQKMDFDVALLGCGAYAMPLGNFVNHQGKGAIVVGGILQTYFGIIGRRWEKRWQEQRLSIPYVHWKRPNEDERPLIWKEIEGNCYW